MGNGESLLNEYRVSLWGDGKVLELGTGDGCTTLKLMPLNCALESSGNGQFYIYFPTKADEETKTNQKTLRWLHSLAELKNLHLYGWQAGPSILPFQTSFPPVLLLPLLGCSWPMPRSCWPSSTRPSPTPSLRVWLPPVSNQPLLYRLPPHPDPS